MGHSYTSWRSGGCASDKREKDIYLKPSPRDTIQIFCVKNGDQDFFDCVHVVAVWLPLRFSTRFEHKMLPHDGSTHNVIKNCTRSTQDCNQASTCERVGDAIAGWGLAFSDCSMTCCEGDVCNAPEEELKLEEEDDHVVEGPITSVSIHSEKKAIKAYHMTLGKKKGRQLKLHGKKKDSASEKNGR
ncbi:hypothetical protein ACROYT_G005096 [Oculina patagonica]